jgi:ketosteroid isomerase-like protein
VFAPEMAWRIEGRSVAANECGDRQQFIDEVLTPFGARFAASPEPFRPVTTRSVHADRDTVIVVWDGRGIASDGEPYENSYAGFMKLRDGKGHRRHRVLRQHRAQRALGARQADLIRPRRPPDG